MKRILLLLSIALLAVVGVYAQDSTATAITSSGIVQNIETALVGKWPLITTIGTALFVVSEWLAAIPSVKANGVFQLIFGALKGLFAPKK